MNQGQDNVSCYSDDSVKTLETQISCNQVCQSSFSNTNSCQSNPYHKEIVAQKVPREVKKNDKQKDALDNSKDIDYVLNNIVGGGGWGQWFVWILLVPIRCAGSLPMVLHIFGAYKPIHRCLVPICDSNTTLNNIFSPSWINAAIPLNQHTTSEAFKVDQTYDSCRMMHISEESNFPAIVNPEPCDLSRFNTSSIVPCQWGYVYDLSLIHI